tara:strand:+ start:281 stop:442 length:162 start_codon:yes stop_codon:yes gene_type:complete
MKIEIQNLKEELKRHSIEPSQALVDAIVEVIKVVCIEAIQEEKDIQKVLEVYR